MRNLFTLSRSRFTVLGKVWMPICNGNLNPGHGWVGCGPWKDSRKVPWKIEEMKGKKSGCVCWLAV